MFHIISNIVIPFFQPSHIEHSSLQSFFLQYFILLTDKESNIHILYRSRLSRVRAKTFLTIRTKGIERAVIEVGAIVSADMTIATLLTLPTHTIEIIKS